MSNPGDILNLMRDKPGYVDHTTLQQVKDVLLDQFDDYYSFTVVRNPWDRIASYYFYQIRSKGKFFKKLRRDFKVKSLRDFVLLIPKIINKPRYYIKIVNLTPVDTISSWLKVDGVVRLDKIKIIELDDLDAEYCLLAEKFGLNPKLTRLRRNPETQPYDKYYDGEMRELIAEIYDEDIQIFGFPNH